MHACVQQCCYDVCLKDGVLPSVVTGLYQAVSLSKGCFLGQEALACTYSKGPAKALWGISMQQSATPGDLITQGTSPLMRDPRSPSHPETAAEVLLIPHVCRWSGGWDC
jgi:hypothetical protein